MRSTTEYEMLLTRGEPKVIQCGSPTQLLRVIFEDDGEAAYFYAVAESQGAEAILDALHVYNASTVTTVEAEPLILRILWSTDGKKAALELGGSIQAAFDFEAKRGWCRSGFPPASGEWSREGHSWDNRVIAFFS